ncbi:protein ALTERED PHOSPHATE STARVATION RESPONSE 1-like [Euphorbia lathyris]|uniref:protein ALTERED PHOSPHATE STARVATION RESPONSE 1-like n=1 Tax=Euphorbia lathyris TaxID=212925 RepID=UPI0033143D1F
MMGCSTSRIDHLPVVSLCHDRCKFLDEALYQSYAFADAHVAYLQSLKSIGPSLSRFFNQIDFPAKSNPLKSSLSSSSTSPPSPNHDLNSDAHLDFPTDSEDEIEEFGDLIHSIQNPASRGDDKYDYFGGNGELFEAAPLLYGGSTWITPSPPPPSGSHWEFLNFFDAYERYDLPPVKEEIDDLKKKTPNINRPEDSFRGDSEKSEKEVKKQSKNVEKTEKQQIKTEKKQIKTEETEDKNRSSIEIIREIEAEFERAADSGNEVLKILDTGKFRFYDKNSIYQSVSSKMLQVVSSSFLVIPSKNIDSKEEKIGSDEVEVNLSSTLKKLCMWENKLYHQVKSEEKLRIVLARSYKQIENMDEKGAEKKKVDSARTLIRTLSIKIRVAIQVIHNTSITINKLRNHELWPFITLLIHKQLEMWKAMQECHKCQSKAIVEAKNLDSILSNEKFNESNLESAIQLKLEIQKWNLNFSSWITAQRCYVKALNNWLLKCLPHKPEEMSDETRPVALIFTFCDRWSHAVGRISEAEVINAMNGLFGVVDQLVQRHYVYLQQRLSEDKELEKRMRILERKEKMMRRVVEARDKKMFPAAAISGGGVHQSEVIQNSSLEFGMEHVFKALEKFSVNNVEIYEELYTSSGQLN